MVINNPHTFFIEIKDSESGNVAYTIPYCTENEPSTADVDDIAGHLVDAVKERWHTLGWRHPDLYYKICFHSAFTGYYELPQGERTWTHIPAYLQIIMVKTMHGNDGKLHTFRIAIDT